MLGHPLGAGEVTFISRPGTGRFARGINMQNDPRDFPPVGRCRARIQQAQVSDGMFVIIGGEGGRIGWRRIRDIGIECVSACNIDPLSRGIGVQN